MKYICCYCGKEVKKKKPQCEFNFCDQKCYGEYRKQEYTKKFNDIFGKEFDLVSFSGDTVTIKCKKCNETLERRAKHVWQKGIVCKECKKRQSIEKDHALEEIRKQRAALSKLITRLENAKKKCTERASKTMTKECACCGKEFETTRNAQVYCGEQCAKKVQYKRHELKRERHIKENGMVDKDISLQKLYERDNGTCYICGNKCDYNDFEKKGEVFIVGKTYPSIDHIIPISKGGEHSWNNIKLACVSCNSKKRDKTYPPRGCLTLKSEIT